MSFRIQDPLWPGSSYYLEDILESCEGATEGAGMFAFASTGGVKLLLEDKVFVEFLTHSRFRLIVGVDSVTNESALNMLQACALKHTNLQVSAFLDATTNRCLFHPKMCWFRRRSSSHWFVGSGNLTFGGLRGNREAFIVAKTKGKEREKYEHTWQSWSGFYESRLRPLDDADVRARARRNSIQQVREVARPQLAKDIISEDDQGNITVNSQANPTDEMLIAEIPAASDRWNQANFSLHTFTHFFKAQPGRTQRLLFIHVDSSGKSGNVEMRPSVAVKSQNFRFELEAAAGLEYPTNGRPIAVFVCIATRTFLYHLLMPGDQDYNLVHNFLSNNCIVPINRVRRLITNVSAVQTAWPGCPLLQHNAVTAGR